MNLTVLGTIFAANFMRGVHVQYNRYDFFGGIMKRMCFFQKKNIYISSNMNTREIDRWIFMWLLHSEVSLLVLHVTLLLIASIVLVHGKRNTYQITCSMGGVTSAASWCNK